MASGPVVFESQFALRGCVAELADGGLLRIGESTPIKVDGVRCVFTTRRFDHANPSSNDDYFRQGGVVLILTLAPPAPVVHGVSRVSAVLVDADLQTIQNRKLVP